MKRPATPAALAALLLVLVWRAPAAPPGPEEYVYVPDTKRLVALIRGSVEVIGRLDSTGTFAQDPKLPVVKLGSGTSGLPYELLNGDPGTAYEYRSGRLILGEIDRDGNFVPALGSKVIAFEQYKPGGNAPPIYNLPGRWVRKGEKKDSGKP